MQISKSDYMLYLIHPAWIWYRKHDKNKLPPLSEELQVIFDEGHEFEEWAEKIFDYGFKLGFTNYDEYLLMTGHTQDALNRGEKRIFQGRFEYQNLTCIVDVLEKAETGFNLYEIKSSTSIKPEHIDDLAFQYYVLKNHGLDIEKMYVIHVNKEYIKQGDIDPKGISVKVDVTDEVKLKLADVNKNLPDVIKVVENSTPPDLSPRYAKSKFSEWLKVYKHLNGGLDKYCIYNLARFNAKLCGELEDLDVKLICNIPDSIKLHSKQFGQTQAIKQDKQLIELQRIKEFLNAIKYPVYFLDYETMSSVIPYFDGTKPYQQIPFQYSLYVLENPNSELMHLEYLHTDPTIPCLPLLKKLKEDIGTEGTIFVWHEIFEKSRNTEMGEIFPEYKDFMTSVNERIIDLKIPFSSDWFIDKDFMGSASIKDVLPVLIKDLSYKDLGIQGGSVAQRIWMETILKNKNLERKNEILEQLLDYCNLDTLAMVRLYDLLNKLCIS